MSDKRTVVLKMIQVLKSVAVMIGCLAGATLIGMVFHWMKFPDTNVVIIYIFSVLLTARFVPGYGYGVAVSVAATLTFNYFFTAPYFTLNVYDLSYLVTFVIMTVTAIMTSALTSRARKSERQAWEKEKIANALYGLTHRLTNAADLDEIVSAVIEQVSKVLGCDAACLCFNQEGCPMETYQQQRGSERMIQKTGEEDFARYSEGNVFGKNTVCVGEKFCDWPIYGKDRILGVLRLPKDTAVGTMRGYLPLMQAMLENTALAMERVWNVQESNRSKAEMTQERYRGNLLRAISHDLRTPLAGIMGSSELLMDMLKEDKEGRELASGVYKDADWLLSLVENILNLTRLQDGRLILNKRPEAVEEILGSAIAHVTKRYPGREITVDIPEELLMVPMDGRLMEQVLVNLMDNAVKHTSEEKEIRVVVKTQEEQGEVLFQVLDEGSGIAPADLPHIFQLFYTTSTKSADAKRGVGLGLAICESIVKMHGGTITAGNRKDCKGAEFSIRLPMEVSHEK